MSGYANVDDNDKKQQPQPEQDQGAVQGGPHATHNRMSISAHQIVSSVRAKCNHHLARSLVRPANTPEERAKIHRLVQSFFPGACTNTAFLSRLVAFCGRHGFHADNTLLGTSVCVDEINSMPCSIDQLMREVLGENFVFGGLGGAAFGGKTAFHAYSNHVPANGHLFILFGPHVAVTTEGGAEAKQCGYYHRIGQQEPSSACGAAMGALAWARSADKEPVIDVESNDLQMDFIKRHVFRSKARIFASRNPEAELAFTMFEFVRDMMLSIVGASALTGKLVLVGGLQINTALEDHFLPLHCTILGGGVAGKQQPVDHLSELVGDKADSCC